MDIGRKKYPHIFSPGQIGKLKTKNRIKYASTETNFNTRDGFVTDTEVAYMEAIARGGPGIVTTQGAFTDPKGEGKGYVGMMGIYDDKFIPGLKRLADVIHANGALAVLQLMHCGRVGGIELNYCAGPSVVPQKLPIFRPPKEMSREDIKLCIQEHIDAARRTVQAGFDIVEISGIVGYLISNFVSKYTNKRTDEYGGDIRGRCKFMVDIIRGIRAQIGPDVPIGIRLCGEELLDDRGGNTPEESLESIKMAEKAGVDYVSVTAGWQESPVSVITRDVEMGHWLYIAERVKKNVKIPVSMAYRLFVPEIPEKAMAEGRLDFWEMCRPMIADPELPNKILKGVPRKIIPCMADNLCLSRLFRDQPLMCMVRPTLGHEGDPNWGYHGFPQVREKKKVLVIGGGPAGLQAAIVAAQRGHSVTLAEKSGKLGGQLATAARGPHGDNEFQRLINYFAERLKNNKVKVQLRKEITPKNVGTPDVIVIATGAVAAPPAVPGGNSKKVVRAHDVIDGKKKVGKKVVVVGGAGVGIATALYLLVNTKSKITVIEESKKVGRDVNPSYVWRYKKKLKEENIEVLTNTKVLRITGKGVVVVTPEGTEKTIPADTVVSAVLAPRKELVESLKTAAPEVYVIGDASSPRRANNAIHEGYRIGMQIGMPRVEIPLEKRFERLAQITRATFFTWRETVADTFKDANLPELVNKFWEITARDTAKGYLRRLDPAKPLAPQIAEAMVTDSINMGEDAKLILGKSVNEAFVHHDGCPWFDWAARLKLLEEDQPGCDAWFFKTVELINKQLGTNVKIETLKSLPKGDAICLRRIWVE
jgi:2,4-dienoyl-CoA reductase (NADPH2)